MNGRHPIIIVKKTFYTTNRGHIVSPEWIILLESSAKCRIFAVLTNCYTLTVLFAESLQAHVFLVIFLITLILKIFHGNSNVCNLDNFGCASAIETSFMAFCLHKIWLKCGQMMTGDNIAYD